MNGFWGIVIVQSCGERGLPDGLVTLAHKRVGDWDVLLVDVPEAELERTIGELRARMVPADEECWYAHFFRDESLVVVFQDEVFAMTTQADSWSAAVAHGRRWGFPDEQLDFGPRTVAATRDWFGLPAAV